MFEWNYALACLMYAFVRPMYACTKYRALNVREQRAAVVGPVCLAVHQLIYNIIFFLGLGMITSPGSIINCIKVNK